MKIIALKGKNGSGKSTVAAMLAKKLDEKGISNKVLSFAEPLKKIVDKAFFPKKSPLNWENRDEKEVGRNLLETTADAIKENFNFNPFVQQLLNLLDLYYDTTSVIIISDLRFESELSGLQNWLSSGDDLEILEITNVLTNSNPIEYDENLIFSNEIIIFDSTLEKQINTFLESIL